MSGTRPDDFASYCVEVRKRIMSQASYKKFVPMIVIVVLIVSACSSAGGSGSGGASGLNPTPQLTLEEADQIAGTFLDAWAQSDYAAMYNLTSPNSRDAYAEESFAELYSDVATQLTLTSLETQITNSLRQGTTAAIQYDVTFHTGLFGDIPDTDRTMRLIETSEGWRLAWSRMDIFGELAEGARLERQQTLPGRGNIYDRNGKVLVDQNGRAVSIYLVQQDILNLDACIDTLSRVLRIEYHTLEQTMLKFAPETRFWIGETDPETYQIEEAALRENCAIGDDANDTLIRNTRRYFGQLAPHVIGYVGQIQSEQAAEYAQRGYPPNALIGQTGIEQSYETYLAGKPGGKLVITAPTGEVLRTIAEAPAEPGQSVYLTIDRDLQEAVQNAFVEAYNVSANTWARTSPGAAAVVMNVKTGEILAMVSYPWYDPSLFNPDSPIWDREQAINELNSSWRTPLLNRATMGKFPAGSVFKLVSTAAGLDSGVYTPETSINCTGTWYGEQYGDGRPFRTDWLPSGHGYVDFSHALTYSCDPYYWQLGVNLHEADPQMLTKYAYEMGLGVSTGQDVLDEEIGQIPNEELIFRSDARSWNISDTLNMVIGQGQMQITPLQITRMVSAVANNGTLWKPLFVSKVQLIGETPSYVAQPTALSTLDYDPDVFKVIQDAMCNVTLDPNGTARYMFENWYDYQGMDVIVCGKTGTAQTGTETTKPEAWFVAFAPQDDPEIAVTVIVENSCEGSEVAAPIVRRIIEDYYHMPHGTWPSLWETGCVTLGEN